MKHVCKCRACEGPAIIKREYQVRFHPRIGGGGYYERDKDNPMWRYVCDCGVRGTLHDKKSEARGRWNADNAEAQSTRRLIRAINAVRE